MSRDEKRLAWLLAVVLVLWVSESWHGIEPLDGLAAAVVTLLPRVGFISGEEFSSGVNIRACIYVAGIRTGDYRDPNRHRGVVGNALLHMMPLDKESPFTSFPALTGDQRPELYYDRQWRTALYTTTFARVFRCHRFSRCSA